MDGANNAGTAIRDPVLHVYRVREFFGCRIVACWKLGAKARANTCRPLQAGGKDSGSIHSLMFLAQSNYWPIGRLAKVSLL